MHVVLWALKPDSARFTFLRMGNCTIYYQSRRHLSSPCKCSLYIMFQNLTCVSTWSRWRLPMGASKINRRVDRHPSWCLQEINVSGLSWSLLIATSRNTTLNQLICASVLVTWVFLNVITMKLYRGMFRLPFRPNKSLVSVFYDYFLLALLGQNSVTLS